MPSGALTILVYVDRYRDRDLWPMVDDLRSAGHAVYYELATPKRVADIVRLASRTRFDVVFTADRVLASGSPELFAGLAFRPRIFEFVLNDLAEVMSHYGSLTVDERLERQNAQLLVMDRALCDTLRMLGNSRVRHCPFGTPSRTVDSGEYYRTRWGRRSFGWQPDRSPIDRPFGKARQWAAGFTPRARSTDVVFLGECHYGLGDADLLHAYELVGNLISPADVRTIARKADAMFPALTGEDISTVTHTLDTRLLLDAHDRAQEIDRRSAFALFRAYLLAQFRSYRRLVLVRRLVEHFGKRFLLFGDDFRRLGLPARDSNYRDADRTYWRAKIAVDFGSNSFDCSVHPRVARIVACNACVIQREQADADHIWERTAPMRTFTDADSMIDVIEQALENDGVHANLMDAQRRLAHTTAAWRVTTRSVLQET